MVTSEDIFGDDEKQATPVPVSIDSDDEEIVHDDAEGGSSVKRAKTSRLSNIMKKQTQGCTTL